MVKYNINKNKGIIVCILTISKKLANGRKISKTFTGIAKCCPDDTFNKAYGTNLAHIRALIKYKEYERKSYVKVISKYKEAAKRCAEIELEYTKRLQKVCSTQERLNTELKDTLTND